MRRAQLALKQRQYTNAEQIECAGGVQEEWTRLCFSFTPQRRNQNAPSSASGRRRESAAPGSTEDVRDVICTEQRRSSVDSMREENFWRAELYTGPSGRRVGRGWTRDTPRWSPTSVNMRFPPTVAPPPLAPCWFRVREPLLAVSAPVLASTVSRAQFVIIRIVLIPRMEFWWGHCRLSWHGNLRLLHQRRLVRNRHPDLKCRPAHLTPSHSHATGWAPNFWSGFKITRSRASFWQGLIIPSSSSKKNYQDRLLRFVDAGVGCGLRDKRHRGGWLHAHPPPIYNEGPLTIRVTNSNGSNGSNGDGDGYGSTAANERHGCMAVSCLSKCHTRCRLFKSS
ncbi:hypothetical protein B0H16DRAFT_1692849, partial [Mycena metata]